MKGLLKMVASQRDPWKHHFVPRSLLRYFRPPGDEQFIHVFDKHKGRAFRTSLMNAGSENGFNTFEGKDGLVNFESDFDEVDASLADRLLEVHAARDRFEWSTEQRRAWADLVAVQLLRTPIVRSTMKNLIMDLRQGVAEEFGAELDTPVLTENDARQSARELFATREGARQAMMSKDLVLFEARGNTPFRISDRPVTLQSSLPFGDAGLDSPGVAVFMPLGQRLMLGLFCQSIARKLNKVPLELLDLPDDVRARLMALREGLASGAVVPLDDDMVKRHNQQQIAGCMRFVYGPTKNFKDVQDYLFAHPEAHSVKSSIKLGKIGQGFEPRRQMPMGSWLVLFGQTETHTLEAVGASDEEPFELTLQSNASLGAALKDGPFSEMRYFVDQHLVRGMREVRLIRLNDTGRVQVRHLDPGLDTLITSVGKRAC
jgi:hypothetical protein